MEVPEIERHRAAIARTDLSRPVRLALEWVIINNDTTFFDYGCGYGGDVERLAARNYTSTGWDPYYRPDTPHTPADIVNLGYVLNVIEDPEERREALCQAWNLTQKVLIVAAQVLIHDRSNAKIAYGDGIVTRRNTFQKYYDQEELKLYIDEVLQVDAVPVALGIYFVFRDETEKESFWALRFRSRTLTPRVYTPSKRFEDYQEILTPLINFMTERGRLPVKGELATQAEILLEFGTFRRAYNVILQATDEAEWDAIAYRRSLDILVYLALTQFGKRPGFNQLALELRQDIKAFFGTYQEACQVADKMLFSLGKPGIVAQTCKQSKIGKLLPTALYVHISALPELDPLLRIYEGCASRTIGRMDHVTLVKFYTEKPKISYLFYPEFDTEAHPALHTSMQIDLQNLNVVYREYDNVGNPPILHRKETFVTQSYPFYEKFAILTRREEKLGLLKNTRTIGTRDGWQQCLADKGVEIKGDRIISKPTT
jgi:DNA phosphorothioation-associated putative methyltransferase